MSAVARTLLRIRQDRFLHKHTAAAHPGSEPYPNWYRWTHVRGHLCSLTGGCAWGPLFEEYEGARLKRFCWKCRSAWANPEETQDLRPWRRIHPALGWLERIERWRQERSINRIRANAIRSRAAERIHDA